MVLAIWWEKSPENKIKNLLLKTKLSQVPFSSVNIGLPENKDAAMICECFLLEYLKGLGCEFVKVCNLKELIK